MAEIKIVIGRKDGKSFQEKVNEENASNLYDKKIGDKFSGKELGIEGLEDYEFQISGGSDASGFPMRNDIEGAGKRRLLSKRSRGFNLRRAGLRRKKTIAGNTVSESTSQLNLKIMKEGKKPLDKESESEKEEAKSEESNKEEPKKEKEENKDKKESKDNKKSDSEKPKEEKSE
jgi:small subunit ribosomal protein S6e